MKATTRPDTKSTASAATDRTTGAATGPMADPTGARAAILARIGAALRPEAGLSIESSYDAASQPAPHLPEPYTSDAQLDLTARLALFTERLREYDAKVFTATPESLAQTLAELLRDKPLLQAKARPEEPSSISTEASTAQAEQEPKRKWIVAERFPAEWLRLAPATTTECATEATTKVRTEATAGADTTAEYEKLDQAAGVLTTCTVAIAVTGTLVLRHGPSDGLRRTTLIPDRHLCVVRASQVVESVPEAFAQLAPFASEPLTFISGPSATADIEMTRICGVHGPRHLMVLLILDS